MPSFKYTVKFLPIPTGLEKTKTFKAPGKQLPYRGKKLGKIWSPKGNLVTFS